MPAGPAHESLRDEVPNRKCIGVAVVRKRIEFVTLLPMLNPDPLVAYRADQDQICVEINVVLSQFGGKLGVASKIVIVIADHHGDLDAVPSDAELIENGLVCRNYVIKLFDPPHEGQFPESERIADYQQFGVGAFVFQCLQKCNELGDVVAMLQLAVTAHVEVADEVTLADSRLLHGLIRLHSVPASLGRIGGYRFRGCQSAGMPGRCKQVGQGRCTREVRNGSDPEELNVSIWSPLTPKSGHGPAYWLPFQNALLPA